MSRHIGLLDGKADAYGIAIPDLPGCNAGGATIKDRMRDAIDAMNAWAQLPLVVGAAYRKPAAKATT